jgi:hypothetical protein
MLKKFTGYLLVAIGALLVAIGFIGYVFFRSYNGSVIPLSTLWFFVSMAIGSVGLYFIYIFLASKISKQEKVNNDHLKTLKLNGEKILLTLDNCEIRNNNYYEEVESESSLRVQEIDALYDPKRNYKQDHIEQSVIIYKHINDDQKIRVVSQSFPLDAVTLGSYIENKMVFLYVDRFDKNDFAFEIIR